MDRLFTGDVVSYATGPHAAIPRPERGGISCPRLHQCECGDVVYVDLFFTPVAGYRRLRILSLAIVSQVALWHDTGLYGAQSAALGIRQHHCCAQLSISLDDLLNGGGSAAQYRGLSMDESSE